MKKATTIKEQIELLRSRNVIISDEDKAKEILLDIGYYRLGFYFFPFEVSYPSLRFRNHIMRRNTKFSDAVALYYFDFDLRNILTKYICRIEVAFRTYVTYSMSNKYSELPLWFVHPDVVGDSFICSFNDSCYKSIKLNDNIRRHHKHYKHDVYAPAWKTLEHMTFGSMLTLYCAIKNLKDKRDISLHFDVNQTVVFENYMETIRCVRNICAHGSVLYDVRLHQEVKRGPAGKVESNEKYRLGAAIKVISYLMGTISRNRQHDLIIELNNAYMALKHKNPELGRIVEESTQMEWELPHISQLISKE
ncbi:MAG: Abi family protein [Paludibacteraceae bacterium]|nr:Abi family protein [Paludibacteraceae bacterium]